MSTASPSPRVHRLAEYIKSAGFWLETDEVEEMGAVAIVFELYGLDPCLSRAEWNALEDELLTLAERNEMREAQVKHRERYPEIRGVMFFETPGSDPGSMGTCHQLPYSYPLDENLKQLRPRPGPSFSGV